MFQTDFYYSILGAMTVLAVIVFIALQRITPAYGITYSPKWDPALNNKTAWIVMEAPAFLTMAAIWLTSPRRGNAVLIVMTALFLIHYFQRSFIFPLRMKGKSRMPLVIMISGLIFNVINAYMIGGWFFYISPQEMYTTSWFANPLFWLGLVIFAAGMLINLQSDSIIRNLRKPGDTRHYIPRGGMYKFVTGANYFGEVTEWLGYAILTWSPGAAVFVIWTFANLGPRARATHKRYLKEFGAEYATLNRRYILPFIY